MKSNTDLSFFTKEGYLAKPLPIINTTEINLNNLPVVSAYFYNESGFTVNAPGNIDYGNIKLVEQVVEQSIGDKNRYQRCFGNLESSSTPARYQRFWHAGNWGVWAKEVIGVKGVAETDYRTGQVSLAPIDLGIGTKLVIENPKRSITLVAGGGGSTQYFFDTPQSDLLGGCFTAHAGGYPNAWTTASSRPIPTG